MYNHCVSLFPDTDIAILSAAVADYKSVEIADQKIKKSENQISVDLEKTKDILSYLGSIKSKQILVGFALETTNEVQHAKEKLVRKNADLIVLNSLNDKGAGFGYDTNKISIIQKNNKIVDFPLKSKKDVAVDIINEIISLIR
jgi:phosphopantothenoylcysteine decarboxylase/phosphopantothenate--cysteine ligase